MSAPLGNMIWARFENIRRSEAVWPSVAPPPGQARRRGFCDVGFLAVSRGFHRSKSGGELARLEEESGRQSSLHRAKPGGGDFVMSVFWPPFEASTGTSPVER